MTRTLALLAAIVVAGGACAGTGRRGPAVSSPAPDIALKDLSGKIVHLGDFRGKLVLLDFWAAWCDPCRESIPFYEKLQESGRALVVGIDEDPQTGIAQAFAKKFGMTYPVLLDRDNDAYDAYGVRVLPTAFLVDASGKILRRWNGFEPGTQADIEKALAIAGPVPNP